MPFSVGLSFCRFASDQLKHEYGVELVNVFDTMLADVVFCSWSSQPPALQKRARGYQVGSSSVLLKRNYLFRAGSVLGRVPDPDAGHTKQIYVLQSSVIIKNK
jgi:hypothetical protein